jgi:hypothetical protein
LNTELGVEPDTLISELPRNGALSVSSSGALRPRWRYRCAIFSVGGPFARCTHSQRSAFIIKHLRVFLEATF